MLNEDEDFEPYPGHPGSAIRYLNDSKKAGEPIEISINGKYPLTIEDDRSFRMLLGLGDYLVSIRDVRASLKFFEEGGKGLSLEEAKELFARKYGTSP